MKCFYQSCFLWPDSDSDYDGTLILTYIKSDACVKKLVLILLGH